MPLPAALDENTSGGARTASRGEDIKSIVCFSIAFHVCGEILPAEGVLSFFGLSPFFNFVAVCEFVLFM